MRITLVVVAVLMSGCPKRAVGPEEQVNALIAEADQAWEARGKGGFGPVDGALQQAWALDPQAPGVLWRLTRLRVGQAQTEPDPVRRVAALGQARSIAWECVRGDARVRALETEVGLVEALAEVPLERQPCVAWASFAWARWVVAFGPPAASLDLTTLDSIAGVARGYADAEANQRSAWADAIVLASRPTWAGKDPDRARALLDDLGASRPGDLEVQLERFELLERGTTAEPAAMAALKAQRTDTPEERAWLARLTESSVR